MLRTLILWRECHKCYIVEKIFYSITNQCYFCIVYVWSHSLQYFSRERLYFWQISLKAAKFEIKQKRYFNIKTFLASEKTFNYKPVTRETRDGLTPNFSHNRKNIHWYCIISVSWWKSQNGLVYSHFYIIFSIFYLFVQTFIVNILEVYV